MRAWIPLLLLALTGCQALGLKGCNDFDVKFMVSMPEGFSRDEVALTASLFMPAQGSEVTCDHLAYGDYSIEELRVSQVGVFEFEGDLGEVTPIPLDGYKLVLVEGVGKSADPLGGTLEAVIVAGCVELHKLERPGPVNSIMEVSVQLEPAVWINASDDSGTPAEQLSFDVDVPWGGEVGLDVLHIALQDGKLRAPPDGTLVRGRLIGPTGAVANEYLIESVRQEEITEEGFHEYGRGAFATQLHFAGTFEVELAARWALGKQKLRVPGFALPLNVETNPFDNQPVYYARPARLGASGAGFVGLSRCSPGGVQQWCVLSSPMTGFGVGERPTFDALAATPITDTLGSDLANDTGTVVLDDRLAYTVVQPSDQGAGDIEVPQKELHVIGADGAARQACSLPNPAMREWAYIVPVGLCQDDGGALADLDANPVAVNMVMNNAQGTGASIVNRMVFADLDSGDVTAVLPLARLEAEGLGPGSAALAMDSHCVIDEQGAQHRLLEFWIIGSGGVESTVLVDMGHGISDVTQVAADYFGAPSRRVDNPGPLVYIDRTENEQGEPLLLALSYLGFSLQVDVHRVSSAGPILRLERVLAGGLPLTVEFFAGGNLVAPQSRDSLLVFSTGSSGGERNAAYVGLLSNTWSDAADPLFGGYPFNADFDLGNSGVYVGGVEGHDRDVLFLLMKAAETGSGSTGPWTASYSVVRFGEWDVP